MEKAILGPTIAKVITNERGKLVLELDGNIIFSQIQTLTFLLDVEYEIVPKPTKLGEMKCREKDCQECPLRMIDCLLNKAGEVTLYEMLDDVCKYRDISKESNIYKAFKEMLDSEKF